MAEEEDKTKPLLDISDASTPDYFAHLVNISVAQSDIVLFFARELEGIDGTTSTLPLVRITVTHDNFIRMANYLAGYGKFLNSVYGENLPSLRVAREKNPDLFREALETHLGILTPSDPSAEEEDPDA